MRALFACLLVSGCGASAIGPGTMAGGTAPMFDLAASTDGSGGFFDFPYPSDLRADERGHPRLDHFPGGDNELLAAAIALVEEERPGFSVGGSVYFRFSGPAFLEPPSPEATAAEGSLIQLVDIDDASPRRGERVPVEVRYHPDDPDRWAPSTLVLSVIPGLHLRPGTRYAAVLLEGFTEVARSPALEALKEPGGTGVLAEHHAALFTALESVGIPRADVVAVTSFTTSDPARELDTLRRIVHEAPLPAVGPFQPVAGVPGIEGFETSFETIEFMSGEPPYTASFGEGRFRFDSSGAPLDRRPRRVRVAISVPAGVPVPPGGWPVVLYGHGTGGDHLTALGYEREGAQLGRVGIATIGFEAALHGERAPRIDVERLLLTNVVAGRETVRQTVVDMMLILRMLEAGAFDVPAAVTGQAHPLRASPVLYMGHSQGAQEGALLAAVEPTLDAAFLSEGGAGALIAVFERELGGMPVACAIGAILGLACDDVTTDHPVMRLIIQPLLDAADPMSFTHRYVREPLPGDRPTHVAMTEGFLDDMTPPRSIEALAAAAGIPIVEPAWQTTLPFAILAIPRAAPPVTANVALPGGARVTAGLMQFPRAGHFAIYEDSRAQRLYVEFFRTAVAGTPTLVDR